MNKYEGLLHLFCRHLFSVLSSKFHAACFSNLSVGVFSHFHLFIFGKMSAVWIDGFDGFMTSGGGGLGLREVTTSTAA